MTTQQPFATPSAGLLQVQELPLMAAVLVLITGAGGFVFEEQQPTPAGVGAATGGAAAGEQQPPALVVKAGVLWLPEQQPPAVGAGTGAAPPLQQPTPTAAAWTGALDEQPQPVVGVGAAAFAAPPPQQPPPAATAPPLTVPPLMEAKFWSSKATSSMFWFISASRLLTFLLAVVLPQMRLPPELELLVIVVVFGFTLAGLVDPALAAPPQSPP